MSNAGGAVLEIELDETRGDGLEIEWIGTRVAGAEFNRSETRRNPNGLKQEGLD
jgi:hypothetical protein